MLAGAACALSERVKRALLAISQQVDKSFPGRLPGETDRDRKARLAELVDALEDDFKKLIGEPCHNECSEHGEVASDKGA